MFLVDVDFVPCQQLGNICSAPTGTSAEELQARQTYGKCVEMCEQGAVLVVPAFELQFCVEEMPKTQVDLRVLWQQQRAEGFHISNFPKGHTPTDFERWFDAEAPYSVEYLDMYEPYIIACKQGLPRYDERFRGYGMNKVSHLHEVAATGVNFIVLHELYITAREHERSASYQIVFGEKCNPEHAVRIALLWNSFKGQVAKKYAHITRAQPQVSVPPPPAYVVPPVEESKKDADDDESYESKMQPTKSVRAGEWVFCPPKTRKPLRLQGVRARRSKAPPARQQRTCKQMTEAAMEIEGTIMQ